MPMQNHAHRPSRRDRAERERIVLDTAATLFYARGVHEVGMDELVRETGLGKATVYRLFRTKDDLIAAYLRRLAGGILRQIDAQSEQAQHPATAAHNVLSSIQADLARPGFRGCAFNNASIEYADPQHPARVAAREYRLALHDRLHSLASRIAPGHYDQGASLAGQLATLIDGAYTSAAHLGPTGPAAAGMTLAHQLVDQAAAATKAGIR